MGWIAAALFAGSCLLFNQTGSTLRALAAAAYRFPGPAVFLRNLSTPRAGERAVLPAETLFILERLRSGSGIETYSLSSGFRDMSSGKRVFIYQRTVEAAQPSWPNQKAADLFLLENETLPADCQEIARGGGVIHARCS